MTRVWRLARPEYADDLTGKGNIASGSRWNSPGRGILYASFNLSLCVLETFIHLPLPLRAKLPEMAAMVLEIPNSATNHTILRGELPADLESPEALRRCREIGDDWLQSEQHLLLIAPSFVVPQEQNVMINPAHPTMPHIAVVSTERFQFDPRLSSESPS